MQTISMSMKNEGMHKTSFTYDNEWVRVKCGACSYEVWLNRETRQLMRLNEGDTSIQHASGMMAIPLN